MRITVSVTEGEDGYFVAQCPALKSCWSQGRTREEALANIREAIELFLEPDPVLLAKDRQQEVLELTF